MEWTVSMKTGGQVLPLPDSPGVSGVYSEDGRYFISMLAHQLRIYFLTTRQCIRTIDVDLHDALDILLDWKDKSLVVVQKPQETIRINWKDRVNSIASQPIDASLPVKTVVAELEEGLLYVSNTRSYSRLDRPFELALIFRTNEGKCFTLYEASQIRLYTISNNKRHLAILNYNQEVLTLDLLTVFDSVPLSLENQEFPQLTVNIINYNYKSPIVSMAINDSGNLIALGSSVGPIQVIFSDADDSEKVLKWHMGPVRALCFSDNYLVSGGDEKVLVIWQIDNDQHQFLPRLNGKIEKISIDDNRLDYYNVLLKMNDSNQFGLLIVSKVDLVSRLSINSIRPNLSKNLSIKNSYSLLEINPKSNNLYFPQNSLIQTFDPIKFEQINQQNLSPSLPMGKVKSELKLMDPTITELKFSDNGEWMCTFDYVYNNDINNLQGDSKSFALKFWKFMGIDAAKDANNSSAGNWSLVTKVINPHLNNPIISIMPYNAGFLTVDSKCNLRFWKYKNKAWYIVKTLDLSLPDTIYIDMTASEDNSMIILGYNNSLKILNNNLQLVKSMILCDGNILSLNLIDTDLIILSVNKLISFDLISFIPNELLAAVSFPKSNTNGYKSWITVSDNQVGLVLNKDKENQSKILIFNSKNLQPIHVLYHDCYINCVKPYNNGFLFVDNQSRIGLVNNTNESMESITTNGIITNNNNAITNSLMKEEPMAELENVSFKQLDINSFNNVFETDNLDTLFDNIIKIIK